jgi:Reverse transcriptase (RNA-dependent DNA polymerase)
MEIDRKFITILALLDFSKAFDTVNFKKLCHKLKTVFFFSDSAIELNQSYLTDRTQSVFANGTFSSFLPVTQGVPQGSIPINVVFAINVILLINVIITIIGAILYVHALVKIIPSY